MEISINKFYLPLILLFCCSNVFGFGEMNPISNDFSFDREDYHASLPALGSGNLAKQMCSCLFVMQRKRDFCDTFTEVDPLIDNLGLTFVNTDNKTINAYLGPFLYRRKAVYQSQRLGCTLL